MTHDASPETTEREEDYRTEGECSGPSLGCSLLRRVAMFNRTRRPKELFQVAGLFRSVLLLCRKGFPTPQSHRSIVPRTYHARSEVIREVPRASVLVALGTCPSL